MKSLMFTVVSCLAVMLTGCATSGNSAETSAMAGTQYNHHNNAATVAATMISPVR
jgi:hypothetical protein